MVLHLKHALCQVWKNLAQCFWRRGFFKNYINVFSLFRNYLSVEKGRALYLNNLKSPLPKDTLNKAWLKLVEWFWIRRFFNFVNVFLLFCDYLPLEKGGPLFEQT